VNRETRLERINKALEKPEYDKPYSIAGSKSSLKVIQIDLSVPLLSHTTMRVAPNLEELSEWTTLREQPDSPEAQELIKQCVINGGDRDEYDKLKDQLREQGQNEPGVMTHEGVLIQGNTRLIALREMREEAGWQGKFSAAVIEKDRFDEVDLQQLDWEMQHREEVKRDYPLTNQLISLHNARFVLNRTEEQIALTMGMTKDEVKKQLLAYQVFDRMRRLPDTTITVERFNTLGRRDKLAAEALKALGRSWQNLREDGKEEEATNLLWAWLLANMVGGEQTRALRAIDPKFGDEFLVPRIEELDGSTDNGDIAIKKITEAAIAEAPESVDTEDPLDSATTVSEGQRVVRALVNALSSEDATVEVPGSSSKMTIPRDDLEAAVGVVVEEAVQRANDDGKADSALLKPVKCINEAQKAIESSIKALKKAQSDSEFKTSANKARYDIALRHLEGKIKQLNKDLDAAFAETDK
jgi:hypothetical protein